MTNQKEDIREQWFFITLKLFQKFEGSSIVEIGCIRNKEKGSFYSDGHSTLRWCKFLTENNIDGYLWIVDNDNFSIRTVEELTKPFENKININIKEQDAIEFLKYFDEPIHLLYLDGWDIDSFNNEYQFKHLIAFKNAEKNFVKNSLILIDDTRTLNNDYGKAEFIIEYVCSESKKDEYEIVFQNVQTLIRFKGNKY